MGCDIHYLAEYDVDYKKTFFGHRSYSIFAFLAGVRNYSAIIPISEPRGLPNGIELDPYSYWDTHSFSWLTIDELVNFNYDQILEDRRKNGDTVEEGDGIKKTYRDYLGDSFFSDLNYFQTNGVRRIVFWFDN